MWNNSDIYNELDKVKKGIESGFDSVKEEMDDHLRGINQNTEEMQSLYDYLSNIDSKLEKLSERMDYFEMMLNPNLEPDDVDISLTRREQEVFMVLYTADQKMRTGEIAKRVGFTEDMVMNYIYNMISKGVPLVKECMGESLLLSLNSRFKDLQARKNILKIEESVAREVLDA